MPVATANVLVWLADRRGYRNLLPVKGLDTVEKVATVARALGSDAYMSTAPKGGTALARFVTGLEAYVRDAGYRPRVSLRAASQRAGSPPPDLAFITDAFSGGAGVWLSIGFFAEGRNPDEWTPLGGHLVTLAGFGVDPDGRTNRDMLVLHDPDDDATGAVEPRHVEVARLRRGWFTDGSGNRVAEAAGHLEIVAGYRLKPGVRAVVLAAVVLEL